MQTNRRDLTLGGLEAPSWCAEILKQYGQNPFGENIMRVVFAPRRIMMYGGYHGDSGLFEYRYYPVYANQKVWVFEKWLSCRVLGTPRSWQRDTANGEGYLSAGPYPYWGYYESVYLFANPETKEFIPLLPDLVSMTARALYCGRIATQEDVRNFYLHKHEFEELQKDKRMDAVWDKNHGVRRGVSFDRAGVLQNNDAERATAVEKIVHSGVMLKKEQVQAGFSQKADLNSII